MNFRTLAAGFVGLMIGVLGLVWVQAAPAATALGKCSSASLVLPEYDGSTIVAGGTDVSIGCPESGPRGDAFVAKFGPSGRLDTDFGTGGMTTVGSGSSNAGQPQAIVKVDNEYLVAGSNFAARLKSDGQIDDSYPPIPFPPEASVDLASNGHLVAVNQTNSEPPNLVVREFDENGQPIGSFGTGGVATFQIGTDIPNGNTGTVALASDGSVALAIENEVIRITPSGAIDNGFGTGGVFDFAAAFPCAECTYSEQSIRSIDFHIDGSLRVLSSWTASSPAELKIQSIATTIAADGSDTTDTVLVQQPEGPLLELPDGDIVGSFFPVAGRHQFKYYYGMNVVRANPDGSSGFSGDMISSTRVGPDRAVVRAVAFDSALNQLVVVGLVQGVTCIGQGCFTQNRALISRLDADTGKPVKSFGTGGSVTLPDPCAGGKNAGKSGTGWSRCPLTQVSVRSKAKIGRAASRSPRIDLEVSLRKFGSAPYDSKFSAVVTLPRGLKLTKQARSRIAVSSQGWNAGGKRPATRFSVNGRKIRITYQAAERDSRWPIPGQNFPILYSDVYLQLKLKRGSLEKVGGPVVGSRVKILGSITPASAGRWYGPTQGSTSTKIRSS